MRKILTGFILLLVLIIGLLLIAPQFIPTETYRKEVTEKAEATLGRKLEINGDIRLRLIPRVQMVLEDVVLHNPKGFEAASDQPFATLKSLRLTVNIWELLDNDLIIEEFELVEPNITLIENKNGKVNWEFAAKEAEKKPTAPAEEKPASTPHVQLPLLSIKDGNIHYLPADANKQQSLEKVQLSLNMPDMRETAVIDFSGVYNTSLPFHVKGDITSPASWLANEETAFALRINVMENQTRINAQGKATPQSSGTPQIQAEIDASVDSLKALGVALKQEILPANWNGYGKTQITTTLAFAKEKLSLSNLVLALDDLNVKGNATVGLSDTPSLHAELVLADALHLDKLFVNDATPATQTETPENASAGSTGYSREPLLADTSVLSSVNADVSLSAPAIHYDQFTIGAVKPRILLKQGKLDISLPDFSLYGGTAKGDVHVSPAGKQSLQVRLNTTVNNANVGELLQAAQATDRLSGHGDLSLALAAQGTSVDGLVRNLNGNAALALKDGSIKGYNLVETMQSLKNLVGNVKALKAGDASALQTTSQTTAKTDFSTLSATFHFTNGIGTNNDLSLKAPLLSLSGAGTIDLPNQRLDYKLTPQVVASVEGQSRTEEAPALNFPVRVSGPFDNLSFRPDTSGLVQELIKDPKGAAKAIEDNVRDVRDGLKSIFKGL